ncbi:hypothetical protein AZE42_07128, partial [Rhizopogon vesiculosus]
MSGEAVSAEYLEAVTHPHMTCLKARFSGTGPPPPQCWRMVKTCFCNAADFATGKANTSNIFLAFVGIRRYHPTLFSMATATLAQNTQRVFPTPVDPTDDAQLRAASKPEEPVAARVIDTKILGTLEQILDVLRGSTIAEERGKDVESRFWATYKRVSNEHDDGFLGRANDDMAIILTFAGLFSAVNSTFIIGTQPNPSNTTNALIVTLINITANGPNAGVDISNLSSSTDYSSATVWMQTLAYA